MTAHWRSGGRHCATCSCAPRFTITIYPPNLTLYGRCPQCGAVRWATDTNSGGQRMGEARHCGCCRHPHNLPPGGHEQSCLDDPASCVLTGR